MKLQIGGFQKVTLLDFPKRVACIIFTIGCNYRCPFCQNSELTSYNIEVSNTEEDILNYLEKRKGIIDGISISGGEPTLQKGLEDFIRKVKKKGFQVKLDTNGSKPQVLEKLINEKLLDYVAMDIKNDFLHYDEITGIKNFNPKNIEESIEIIKNSGIEYEFRTTVIKEYHSIDNIKCILNVIGKDAKYYLQNFKDSENVPKHELHGFTDDELNFIRNELIKDYPNLKIRGLKS